MGDKCTLALATQGSSKVYKTSRKSYSDSSGGGEAVGAEDTAKAAATTTGTGSGSDKEAYQSLRCTVGASALMALLPQPLTCYKGAQH